MRLCREMGALWLHDGNPKRPHALLTSSSKHSNGFFNSKPIIDNKRLLNQASCDLTNLLLRERFDIDSIDLVVGPPTGAIRLAKRLSCAINERRSSSRPCYWASPEKKFEGQNKRMVFQDTRMIPGERVLLCEDVITTGESLALTAQAIINEGGSVIPSYVLALVNRSGFAEIHGRKIIALIDHPMPAWTPKECLLCPQGSEAIRPKGAEEWKRLNAAY